MFVTLRNCALDVWTVTLKLCVEIRILGRLALRVANSWYLTLVKQRYRVIPPIFRCFYLQNLQGLFKFETILLVNPKNLFIFLPQLQILLTQLLVLPPYAILLRLKVIKIICSFLTTQFQFINFLLVIIHLLLKKLSFWL